MAPAAGSCLLRRSQRRRADPPQKRRHLSRRHGASPRRHLHRSPSALRDDDPAAGPGGEHRRRAHHHASSASHGGRAPHNHSRAAASTSRCDHSSFRVAIRPSRAPGPCRPRQAACVCSRSTRNGLVVRKTLVALPGRHPHPAPVGGDAAPPPPRPVRGADFLPQVGSGGARAAGRGLPGLPPPASARTTGGAGANGGEPAGSVRVPGRGPSSDHHRQQQRGVFRHRKRTHHPRARPAQARQRRSHRARAPRAPRPPAGGRLDAHRPYLVQ